MEKNERTYKCFVIIVICQKVFMENAHTKIRIDRAWSMPNRWTFKIRPIKDLLEEEITGGGRYWLDPFAGYNSPAEIKNDIDKDAPVKNHEDALSFLKGGNSESVVGTLYDPPYSITQARQYGKKEFSPITIMA